ncbi:amidohydrolase family protein [Mycobacteroides franklinii]|uniref:amidohydrolase family protein n=1 Tax=Mycobacteroides franklinii TaxID=948102 RepID=UPI0013E8C406|nr:amidohydrolase [Mycobacteroides franklinii]
MSDIILTAATVITMDDDQPRAEAIAVSAGVIVAVGSLAECTTALPGAELIETGAGALLPGFVEPHGHPFMSGVITEAPVRSIAPWKAQSWDDVTAAFQAALAETDPSEPLIFSGFDALLHEHPALDAHELDQIFGDRVAAITDNSGHGIYFGTALIKLHGWDSAPPADPVGGHYQRNPDGTLNGRGFEVPALTAVLGPLIAGMGNPLHSAALFFAAMARAGYTSTSDMSYDPQLKPAYEALAAAPSCPLRVSLWEMSTTETYSDTPTFTADADMLGKTGVKLWTDGAVWVGTGATSFPYVDSEATRRAAIDSATAGGTRSLNYSREQLDAILDRAAPLGWQMAFHSNGDLAVELALDAYEAALVRHGLLGTDHRWRLEHVGGATRAQLDRAARLGVHVSMSPFQYYFWGDLLDGQIFDHEHGSQWQPFADAVASGACVSLHNDGSVSPPSPLTNIQTVTARRTRAGNVHGPGQAITLDEALRAQTINAARTLRRDHRIGSITVGKLADFVELSKDPYDVDPAQLIEEISVNATWIGGRRIDLDVFLDASSSGPSTAPVAPVKHCC